MAPHLCGVIYKPDAHGTTSGNTLVNGPIPTPKSLTNIVHMYYFPSSPSGDMLYLECPSRRIGHPTTTTTPARTNPCQTSHPGPHPIGPPSSKPTSPGSPSQN